MAAGAYQIQILVLKLTTSLRVLVEKPPKNLENHAKLLLQICSSSAHMMNF